MHLILASASPRRAELLRAAGYEFDVAPVDVNESVEPGEVPARYVRRLAAAKSAAAQKQAPSADVFVLGADTVVVVDGAILGKPTNDADAARMLNLLSAKHHQVLTGVSLRHGAHELGRVDTTTV